MVQLLWSFIKAKTGAVFVEFVLILSLLMLGLATATDLMFYVRAHRDVNEIATMASDVVTRGGNVTLCDMQVLFRAAFRNRGNKIPEDDDYQLSVTMLDFGEDLHTDASDGSVHDGIRVTAQYTIGGMKQKSVLGTSGDTLDVSSAPKGFRNAITYLASDNTGLISKVGKGITTEAWVRYRPLFGMIDLNPVVYSGFQFSLYRGSTQTALTQGSSPTITVPPPDTEC